MDDVACELICHTAAKQQRISSVADARRKDKGRDGAKYWREGWHQQLKNSRWDIEYLERVPEGKVRQCKRLREKDGKCQTHILLF